MFKVIIEAAGHEPFQFGKDMPFDEAYDMVETMGLLEGARAYVRPAD